MHMQQRRIEVRMAKVRIEMRIVVGCEAGMHA